MACMCTIDTAVRSRAVAMSLHAPSIPRYLGSEVRTIAVVTPWFEAAHGSAQGSDRGSHGLQCTRIRSMLPTRAGPSRMTGVFIESDVLRSPRRPGRCRRHIHDSSDRRDDRANTTSVQRSVVLHRYRYGYGYAICTDLVWPRQTRQRPM